MSCRKSVPISLSTLDDQKELWLFSFPSAKNFDVYSHLNGKTITLSPNDTIQPQSHDSFSITRPCSKTEHNLLINIVPGDNASSSYHLGKPFTDHLTIIPSTTNQLDQPLQAMQQRHTISQIEGLRVHFTPSGVLPSSNKSSNNVSSKSNVLSTLSKKSSKKSSKKKKTSKRKRKSTTSPRKKSKHRHQ
mmetsp:Transcript_10140/g.15280  ORF Transcript_10140/g.15280 Transcript_10140/m.15280 type:complete len:189 (+) Transcript_10140:86-652(+)